mmetsp:Transcript_23356/g.55371  ORF Transcript_23356/g.55371 Transcript_23356/m.55371 type:complete len:349 (+) Transcript_23356:165-1211(+)
MRFGTTMRTRRRPRPRLLSVVQLIPLFVLLLLEEWTVSTRIIMTVAASEPASSGTCSADSSSSSTTTDGTCASNNDENKENSKSSGRPEPKNDSSDDEDEEEAEGDDDDDEYDEEEDEEEDDFDVWTEGNVNQMYEELGCPENNDGFTKVHSQETWQEFNRIYNKVVGPSKSSLPPKFTSSGFQYPVEIKHDPVRGRGVYVKTTTIPKGSLIWQSTNTAIFDDPQDYRTFILSLPPPLACDVLIWAYSRMISDDRPEEFYACVDLDEGSFINSIYDEPSLLNMAIGLDDGPMPDDAKEDIEKQTWYGCSELKFYALKDIPPGTEIIADYGEFAEPHGWIAMGLFNTLS